MTSVFKRLAFFVHEKVMPRYESDKDHEKCSQMMRVPHGLSEEPAEMIRAVMGHDSGFNGIRQPSPRL